jgi:glycosyltransferase involved in cell wall biosynthesis
VHSRWTAEQAVASGIDPAKVQVIPHGVDLDLLTPHGPRSSLVGGAAGTAGSFTFLFVGAAVARKGADILLDAYGRAFEQADPVTLVVKDHTGDVFYDGVGLRDRVEAFRARPGAPRLVYLDAYLDAPELAALYRACDVAVFPYRAEGFAMPILEAMACATPAIVPRFGPCLDFCDEESAFFVPARRIRLPVGRNLQFNTLGFREEVEEVDFCEIDPAVLAAEMRRTAALPREALERAGSLAAERARAFTWDAALARICERLRAAPGARPSAAPRLPA